MRKFLVLAALAGSASAGPPQHPTFEVDGLSPAADGMWAVGKINCDEGGVREAAIRLSDGHTESGLRVRSEPNPARTIYTATTWSSDGDLYTAGKHASVSHDGGKHARSLTGLGEGALSIVGVSPDMVFAVTKAKRIAFSTDHGFSWQPLEFPLAFSCYRVKP
jgi:hypothetical protein